MKLPSVRKYLPAYIVVMALAVVLGGKGYTWLRTRLRFWPMPPGTIVTVAGTGDGASAPVIDQARALRDGEHATDVPLIGPGSMAMDAAGNLYVVDLGVCAIRKIDRHGLVTTVMDGHRMDHPDRKGADARDSAPRPATGGPQAFVPPECPFGIAAAAAGGLFMAEPMNHMVRELRPDGSIRTIAGKQIPPAAWPKWFYHPWAVSNGPATQSLLLDPERVAVDARGNLFVADVADQRIDRVDPHGRLTVVAGLSGPFDRARSERAHANSEGGAFSGDGGPATTARLNRPYGLAVDAHGNLFVADTGNFRVRKIDRRGVITTVAGTGPSERRSDGVPICRPSGDGGPAVQAGLEGPVAVAVDSADNLFIIDRPTIRKVDSRGIITTIAGQHSDPAIVPDPRYPNDRAPGTSGDDGPATRARLVEPRAICIDAEGNLFVSTGGGGYIRKIIRAAAPGLLAGHPLPPLAGAQ